MVSNASTSPSAKRRQCSIQTVLLVIPAHPCRGSHLILQAPRGNPRRQVDSRQVDVAKEDDSASELWPQGAIDVQHVEVAPLLRHLFAKAIAAPGPRSRPRSNTPCRSPGRSRPARWTGSRPCGRRRSPSGPPARPCRRRARTASPEVANPQTTRPAAANVRAPTERRCAVTASNAAGTDTLCGKPARRALARHRGHGFVVAIVPLCVRFGSFRDRAGSARSSHPGGVRARYHSRGPRASDVDAGHAAG